MAAGGAKRATRNRPATACCTPSRSSPSKTTPKFTPGGQRRTTRKAVQRRILEQAGFRRLKPPPGAKPTYPEAWRKHGHCIAGQKRDTVNRVAWSRRDDLTGETIINETKAGSIRVPRKDGRRPDSGGR